MATFLGYKERRNHATISLLVVVLAVPCTPSAMEATNMSWKLAIAVLIVFALRWLARRFRDPDTYFD